MQDTFKKGLGDRYDGWRVRNVDAVFNVIPFIMRTRMDSQNLFEENIPIENIEKFIRKHREDMPKVRPPPCHRKIIGRKADPHAEQQRREKSHIIRIHRMTAAPEEI